MSREDDESLVKGDSDMSDQPDKDSADADDTMQAPPSEEPETAIVASDTTNIDRNELAWSLDEIDELKAEHRSWTDTWKTTAIILACAALVAAMVGGLIWAWHAVNSHSAAPSPTTHPTVAPTTTPVAPITTPAAPPNNFATTTPPVPTSSAFIDPNAPTQDKDALYVTLLQIHGIYAKSRNDSIYTAHLVCLRREEGQPKEGIAREIASANTSLTALDQANFIVGTAIGVYCPQFGGQ
jgi:hypothetical protein